jgi:hypothetical protein
VRGDQPPDLARPAEPQRCQRQTGHDEHAAEAGRGDEERVHHHTSGGLPSGGGRPSTRLTTAARDDRGTGVKVLASRVENA